MGSAERSDRFKDHPLKSKDPKVLRDLLGELGDSARDTKEQAAYRRSVTRRLEIVEGAEEERAARAKRLEGAGPAELAALVPRR